MSTTDTPFGTIRPTPADEKEKRMEDEDDGICPVADEKQKKEEEMKGGIGGRENEGEEKRGEEDEEEQKQEGAEERDDSKEEANDEEVFRRPRRGKWMRAPRMPSKAEKKRHSVTHWPYAPWCKWCVMGRAVSSPHRYQASRREIGSTPTIGIDYCFPWGQSKGDEEEKEATVLVAKEITSGAVLPSIAPAKGAAFTEVISSLSGWMDELGFPKFILRCDQESSIKAVQSDVKEQLQKELKERKGDRIVIPENAPVGDSQGNGLAESGVKEVEGYIRTHTAELEEMTGLKFKSKSSVIAWLVRHVGTLISRVKIQSHSGMTAYEYIKGKTSVAPMMTFGESVLCKVENKRGGER